VRIIPDAGSDARGGVTLPEHDATDRMRTGRLYRPRCPSCGSDTTRPAHVLSNACVALFSVLGAIAGGCTLPTKAAWTCRTCGETFEDDAD